MHPLAEAMDYWAPGDLDEEPPPTRKCRQCGKGTPRGSRYCRRHSYLVCDVCGVSYKRKTGSRKTAEKTEIDLCPVCRAIKYDGASDRDRAELREARKRLGYK